jgi:D-alanine-D-alanine ligase
MLAFATTAKADTRPSVAVDDRLQAATEKLLANGRLAVVYAGDRRDEDAVIYPGNNLRPWKSYKSVALDIAEALTRMGARKVEVVPEDMGLPGRLRTGAIDFAWLNTGGVQGIASAGHAAATLEMLGVPYVGHDPLTGATLDNKAFFKRHLAALGIPTAPSCTWHPDEGPFLPEWSAPFQAAFCDWQGGYVVKPVNGRASLHVVHVARRADLVGVVLDIFEQSRNRVLIEAYLPGREYCAAVSGSLVRRKGLLQQTGAPFVFGCIERRLDPGEKIFTSMDERPITAARLRPLDANADHETLVQLESLAQRVYRELPLQTLVRLDVRADEHGRLHVLEANPKPDLKAPQDGVTSIIAEGLSRAGLSYDDLVFSLLADSLGRCLTNQQVPLSLRT